MSVLFGYLFSGGVVAGREQRASWWPSCLAAEERLVAGDARYECARTAAEPATPRYSSNCLSATNNTQKLIPTLLTTLYCHIKSSDNHRHIRFDDSDSNSTIRNARSVSTNLRIGNFLQIFHGPCMTSSR